MFNKIALIIMLVSAQALGAVITNPNSPIIYANGCAYDLISQSCISTSSGSVASVFGRTGTVVSQTGDYSYSQITGLSTVAHTGSYTDLSNQPTIAANTDQLPEGTSNLYYTNTRVNANIAAKYQVANGITQLDVNGKVLTTELPSSVVNGLHFVGTWNANTNTPTLSNSGGGGVAGDYYIVSVAGTTSIDGNNSWAVGDSIINGGSSWYKVGQTQDVISVNGATGIVALNTDNVAEGSTNLYFLNSRARGALTAVDPLLYNSSTGVFGINNSGTASSGSLTSTDWNTFNSKQSALTFGSVSTSTTGVTVANGASSTVGPNVTVNVQTASASQPGLLSASDFSVFNSKEPAITAGTTSQYWRGDKTFQTLNTSIVPESSNLYFTTARAQSSISTTSPLTYASGVVGCQASSGSQAGCLSSTDWTTFNGKQSALGYTPVNKAGDQMTGQWGEAVVSLTYGSTISVNATQGNVFDVTLTGATALLANPTGAYDGQKLTFRIHQDATGNRAITLGTNYKFGTGLTNITLSTSPNATDVLGVVYYAALGKYLVVAFAGGF